MAVLQVSNGFSDDDLKQIIAQMLRRCLERYSDLKTYIQTGGRSVALSDFWCPHMSHSLWNLMSGWANVLATVPQGAFDLLFVYRDQAFFGLITELFPEGVKPEQIDFVENDDDIFNLMLKQNALLFCVKDENLTDDFAQRIIKRAYSQCSAEFLSRVKSICEQSSPLVLITIRLDNRARVEQEEGWPALFKQLRQDFPKIGLVIDGLSSDTPKGWTTYWMSLEAEQKIASTIEEQLSGEMPVINSVGGKFAESIVLSDLIDAFVAPSGSGMAIYKWITNKPGVAFSNKSVLDEKSPCLPLRVWDHFRPGIIEARYLAAERVRDVEANNHGQITRNNFSMDWRDLHTLTDGLLSELFPHARAAAPDIQDSPSCIE